MESTDAQPASQPPVTGITRIEEKYAVDEDAVVGRGAWSVVKRCTPISPYVPPGSKPGMKFVVKIIEKDYLISLTKGDVDRAMAEVNREIDVLRHIPAHENVVTFFEHIETEKQFLLFFEEVQCGDLCEIILQSADGNLSEEKSKHYTYQIIKAVLHCHIHDVIHRDIKPENLLVSVDNNIKLTDFGLAKRSKSSSTSAEAKDPLDPIALCMPYPGAERLIGKHIVCSDVIGTPRYGAPEMFYAKFTQTHYDGLNADTWSVGVVTYITLSGNFPYSAVSHAPEKEVFRTIMDTALPEPPNISPAALDFVRRLLHKDPHKRMSLCDALQHPWLEGVAPLRRSVTAARLLEAGGSADLAHACRAFDREAQALHGCLRLLQRENQRLREAHERREEFRAARDPRGTRRASTPRRAGTAAASASAGSATRARTARSPAASNSMRVASPARTGVQPGRTSTSESSHSFGRRASANRNNAHSPLARSAASTVRRGTPLRAGWNATARSGTPSRTTGNRSASTSRAVSRPSNGATSTHASATSAASPSTQSRTAPRCGTPSRSSLINHVSSAKDLHVGETVTYKGFRALVRFNGSTAFGAGIWIGLEMLEGNEGTNDGSSFIDKKQYFTCPKGKGVFVRASQVKKL